jgi:hypothetical protein
MLLMVPSPRNPAHCAAFGLSKLTLCPVPGTSNTLTNSTAIGADALVSADNALVPGNHLVSVGIGTQAPAARLHVAKGISTFPFWAAESP